MNSPTSVQRRPVRVGAVTYLNTKPLVSGLPDETHQIELTFDYPSRLADRLRQGSLDVALIPSIEYLRNPSYQIVSDACIACRGPVLSVKLLSRVPMRSIQTLALDAGSRTSGILARILLWERFQLRPQLEVLPIDVLPEDSSADAVLVIGDRAIHAPPQVFADWWDLGAEWCRWSGLPFVFALWGARGDISLSQVSRRLAEARDSGQKQLREIARIQAETVGLSESQVYHYLHDNLHFYLGERERRGMEMYFARAKRLDRDLVDSESMPGAFSFVQPSPYVPERKSTSHRIFQSVRGKVLMIARLLEKTVAGERLRPEEGSELLRCSDLTALGQAADAVTRRMHPENYRTYNIDRNINYTNICTAVCDFCAFYRKPNSEAGYVLDREALLAKVAETVAMGGNQTLLQGGLHPKFRLDWYENLLRDIRDQFPTVNVHGFSPPELFHFSKLNRLPLRTVLERLKAAGLGSIPGGGAEILVDRVRRQITRGKVLTDDWLNVMRVWHELGGRSSATMMFGHVETLDDRIEHLERLRQLQDETHGFTAFIGWTFQPDNTDMAQVPKVGAFEYLKTQAVARLYLDNFENIQSSWVTQGLKIGQMALLFGANDMGSLMIEENVVAQAGTIHSLTLQQIRDAISELGFVPRQRDVFYELVDRKREAFAIQANQATRCGVTIPQPF